MAIPIKITASTGASRISTAVTASSKTTAMMLLGSVVNYFRVFSSLNGPLQ